MLWHLKDCVHEQCAFLLYLMCFHLKNEVAAQASQAYLRNCARIESQTSPKTHLFAESGRVSLPLPQNAPALIQIWISITNFKIVLEFKSR